MRNCSKYATKVLFHICENPTIYFTDYEIKYLELCEELKRKVSVELFYEDCCFFFIIHYCGFQMQKYKIPIYNIKNSNIKFSEILAIEIISFIRKTNNNISIKGNYEKA